MFITSMYFREGYGGASYLLSLSLSNTHKQNTFLNPPPPILAAAPRLVQVVRDSRASGQLLAGHAPALRSGRGTAGANGVGGVPGDAAPGLAGCVRHPTEADVVATAGSDGTVRLWSLSGRCALAVLELGSSVTALAWAPAPGGAASAAAASLVCALAPSGSLVEVSVDIASGAMAKSRVVVPSLTPVSAQITVSADGALVQCTGGCGGADGKAQSVNCLPRASRTPGPGPRGSRPTPTPMQGPSGTRTAHASSSTEEETEEDRGGRGKEGSGAMLPFAVRLKVAPQR